jgi:hypothetical protein
MNSNDNLQEHIDFVIDADGKISNEFRKKNIFTFRQAAGFIRNLPYGRNANKSDLVTLFMDNCGTCGTKHGVLQLLAGENKFNGFKLTIGLFKMNAKNTPEVATTLKLNHLEYIPEAHCYLKWNGLILDYTKSHSKPSDFIDDLIEELEILPDQITDYKVNYHRSYLGKWLAENQIQLTLDEIWAIREQCIRDLAANRQT